MTTEQKTQFIKEKCKYCEHEKNVGGAMIMDYNKKEAKLYGEHLRHKNDSII